MKRDKKLFFFRNIHREGIFCNFNFCSRVKMGEEDKKSRLLVVKNRKCIHVRPFGSSYDRFKKTPLG